ncbi:MAG: FHA domain-containing protein, partial [Pseudomonadota bacterium]
MTLTLRIDNLTSLPDGGPMEFRVDQAGFEIGRDPNTDWTLPDPSRFVSSRHLEIRFSEGGYWLHDVSTNGTFVNGATMRVKSPYALQHGDRLQVGHYLVVVDLGGGQAPADPMGAGAGGATPGGGSDIWSVGTTPPPASAGFDPMPRPNTPLPDFGSQHIDNPAFGPGPDSAEPFPSPDPSAAVVKDFGAFGAAEEASDSPFGGPAPSKSEPPLKGDPSKAQSLAQPDSSAEPPSPFRSPEQTAPPPEPGAATPARPISSPVFAPGAGEPVARPDFPPSSPEWEPEAPASEAFLQSPPAKAPEPAPPRKPSSSGQADWLNLICESAGLPPGTLNGARG